VGVLVEDRLDFRRSLVSGLRSSLVRGRSSAGSFPEQRLATERMLTVKRLSVHMSQGAHQAGVYPGFCNMKRPGIFFLPPGWDASPSQGYP